MTRPYQITLFAASSETGRLCAHYLAAAWRRDTFTWAIAGSNLKQLSLLRRALKAEYGQDCSPGVLKVKPEQQQSLDAMAAQTRVLLNASSAPAQHGEPVVRACVHAACDYVDASNDSAFIDFVQRKFHAAAERQQIKLINGCELEGLGSDMAALFAVQTLAAKVDARNPQQALAAEAVTLHSYSPARPDSAAEIWQTLNKQRLRCVQRRWNSAVAGSCGQRHVQALPGALHWQAALSAWGVSSATCGLPLVLRSACASGNYGERFEYGQYTVFQDLPQAALNLLQAGRARVLRKLRRAQPSPAAPAETAPRQWSVLAESSQERVQVSVQAAADDSSESAKILAEAALHLALQANVPAAFGALTPVQGLGSGFIPRLQRAGMQFVGEP